jgi:hypothetical protein
MEWWRAEGVRPADAALLRHVASDVRTREFTDTADRLLALADTLDHGSIVTAAMVDAAIDAIGNPWGGPKLGHAMGDDVYRANVRRMLEAALR